MEIRRAHEGDLEGIAAARLSNGPAHDDSGANPHYCRHLIAKGHLVVADDGGPVVGFGGAVDVGDARVLSDLYVHAQWHGRGVGAALLAVVLDGAAERLTFASNDPATIPLYTRAGMLCRWPLLTLEGRVDQLPEPSLVAREVDAAEVAAVELAITGIDRSTDHVYWASRPNSGSLLLESDDVTMAAAAVRVVGDDCRIEHLAATPGCEMHAVAAAARWRSKGELQVYVPGDRPLVADLLAAGFRVTDTGMHMSTTASAVHPRLAVVHPGLG